MPARLAGPRIVLRTGVVAALLLAPIAFAILPFPAPGPGVDPYDWPEYLFVSSGDCSAGNASSNDLPGSFDCENDWKFTDYRSPAIPDPAGINQNPQEFYGVRGVGTNKAWEISAGRPDVVIAVLDSGIRWEENRPGLIRKYYLNRGELPLPQDGVSTGNPDDTRFGGYDMNGDGIFNVVDYWNDPRVSDLNGNGAVDPEDLIRIFSDSTDADGNGYVDDISGWDFFENDNNPQDDVDYGHGTGEAEDSTGEAGFGDGQCPMCMMMPMRVGDSFVADVNHFAEAVVYATDNEAAVIQEALGTLNHTSFGQAAIDYAYRSGVIIMASEADEAAGHHMWPAAYEHTLVVNSYRTSSIPAVPPQSYLFFNGCTNFGAYTFAAIPSTSCSSEAVGRSSGISGLLQSAALNAVERGSMTNYVRDDGTLAPFPLSGEEMKQLWRLSADDIDFSSPCPDHEFCPDAPAGVIPVASPNNYAPIPQPDSTRYQTVKGWDYFSGYGRSNAARLLRFIGVEGHSIHGDREYLPKPDGTPDPYGVGSDPDLSAQDRIPPEADLQYPRFWQQYAVRQDLVGGTSTLVLPDDPSSPGEVVLYGRAAANRVTAAGGSFDYVIEYAPHVQGQKWPLAVGQASTTCSAPSGELSGGPWTEVACVTGNTSAVEGELARIDVDDLLQALTLQPNPFDPATDPTSEFQPEQHAVRLRLRVIAHPVNGDDDVNNEAVHQKQIDVYPAVEAVMRDDLGVPHPPAGPTAVPGLADSDFYNQDALGRYAGGAGAPSFHDLDGDGVDEAILPVSDGLVHAYTNLATGEELPGWPVSVDLLDGVADRLVGDGSTPVDNAYTRGDVVSDVFGAILLGTAAVADLDDDGTLEVLAADLEGKLYAWEHDGSRRSGFPVSVDRASYSKEVNCTAATIPACDDYESGPIKREKYSARDWGFNSAPAVGDLDPTTPGLEIVIGSNDSHVYAWHQDGSPVTGWPVVLRDPTKIDGMDPVSHHWTYAPGSNRETGAKILVSPALGDLDGDGDLEVVIPVNEQYADPINADVTLDPALLALGAVGSPGNVRIYALHHTGAATPETAAHAGTAHLQDQAYVEGWPVPTVLVALGILPYVGEGSDGPAALADIDGDGTLEVATASAAGPGYLLNADGSSFLGNGPSGAYRTLETDTFGAGSTATDTPSYIGVGQLAFGSLDGGLHLSVAGPGAGLLRLLDIVLEADQVGAGDHLNVWDARTGLFEQNFPINVNDLQFFTQPVVADITGDGLAEVIQSTAVGDTVAAGLTSTAVTATRYFTGGWIVAAATVGDSPLGESDDGLLHSAFVTREGYLRVVPTPLPITAGSAAGCAALQEWPESGHDAHNSGNYEFDAERPYPLRDVSAPAGVTGTVVDVSFTATGDDRGCGSATEYRVRSLPGDVSDPDWLAATPLQTTPVSAASGASEVLTVSGLSAGTQTLLIRAYDDAGNGSAPSRVVVLPEPGRGTSGLALLGLLAVLARRRRQLPGPAGRR